MLSRPRALVAMAILMVAALPIVRPDPVPTIAPSDAARHEGSRVRLQGILLSSEPRLDGTSEFVLGAAGHAVAVRARVETIPPRGAWVEAEGLLLRWNGVLRLHADRVESRAGDGPQDPGWPALAADPAGWQGRSLQLAGDVRAGALHGDGHHVRLGDGPWPARGHVVARGIVAYDAACLCHRFHATDVAPWTP